MSTKEFKTTIVNLKKWLLAAEEIIEDEKTENLFISKYGKEFYIDFTDLIDFSYLYTLPKAISVFQGKLNEIQSLNQAKKVILEFIKQLINLHKPKGKKKKKIKEILSKLEEKLDESIPILRKEWNDLEEILNELTDNLPNPESEEGKEGEETEETGDKPLEEMIDKINLYHRINAYFVIALYAIIETYCLSFIQDSLSRCSKETLYQSFNKPRSTYSNPINSLKGALDVQKIGEQKLTDIRTQLVRTLQWEIHQESFKSFIEVRSIPAHQKTGLSLEELKEKFPKHLEIAEENFKKILKLLENEKIPSIVQKPLIEGLDDLRIGLYLKEIANSCLRYLLLHEALFQCYFNENQFVEKMDEILKKKSKESDWEI